MKHYMQRNIITIEDTMRGNVEEKVISSEIDETRKDTEDLSNASIKILRRTLIKERSALN